MGLFGNNKQQKEQAEETETYTQTLWCNNCNDYFDLEIPKGQTITSFSETKECETCGCNAGWTRGEEE